MNEDGSPGHYRYASAALAVTGCVFIFAAVCYLLAASARACMKGIGKTKNQENSVVQSTEEQNSVVQPNNDSEIASSFGMSETNYSKLAAENKGKRPGNTPIVF